MHTPFCRLGASLLKALIPVISVCLQLPSSDTTTLPHPFTDPQGSSPSLAQTQTWWFALHQTPAMERGVPLKLEYLIYHQDNFAR